MTCDPHKFTSFSPDCSKTFIINANGVSSPIESVGIVCLSPSLSIPNVLFVPTLNCNFLSVSKLTKSHSCIASFYLKYNLHHVVGEPCFLYVVSLIFNWGL